MVNNKISYELCAAAEAAESGIRRTWSPEQYRECAAKLDRLVEAARAIREDAREHDTLHPNHVTVGRTLIDEMEAALRDIEFPGEVKHVD